MDARLLKARIQGRIVRYEAARERAARVDALYSVAAYNGRLRELRDILEMLED